MNSMLAGAAIKKINNNKKSESQEIEMTEKYAAAQLEQKVSDLREKPNLKVHREGAEGTLEAEDGDLDILTDAVHGALVSYYKRKHGYVQCCKYLVFLMFFLLVVFLETHVGEGKYTHGVAHTLKETLFPDMAGDNIGFPGGRVPKRLSGWNNVYEFFSDSVAKHFNNPKIGDTLCTGPTEFKMWGGFGSTDCGKSDANVSKATITVTLTPELINPTQTNIVCPPEARSFRLLEHSEFDFETSSFTIFADKVLADTTTVGAATTWVPVVGYTLVLGSTFNVDELRVLREKIPAFQTGATYRIATSKARLDLVYKACGGTMANPVDATTTTTARRLNSNFQAVHSSSRRKLLMMPPTYGGPMYNDPYNDPYNNGNSNNNGGGDSYNNGGGTGCKQAGGICMMNSECCDKKCDMNTQMCESGAIGVGGGSGTTAATPAVAANAYTGSCYYAYDISLVPESVFTADKSGKKLWRMPENLLETGCNITYWNYTNGNVKKCSHPSNFDCSSNAKDLSETASSITCANQDSGCTATECCTVTPAFCQAAGGNPFNCCVNGQCGSPKPEQTKIKCNGAACALEECCYPPGTCGSVTFDCSTHAKNVDGTVECGTNPMCSQEVCCTITPPPKTCADINAAGSTGGQAFDCSGDAKDINASPAGITCAAQNTGCTASECCTVTSSTTSDCVTSDTNQLTSACKCDSGASTNECAMSKYCWVDNTCNDAAKSGQGGGTPGQDQGGQDQGGQDQGGQGTPGQDQGGQDQGGQGPGGRRLLSSKANTGRRLCGKDFSYCMMNSECCEDHYCSGMMCMKKFDEGQGCRRDEECETNHCDPSTYKCSNKGGCGSIGAFCYESDECCSETCTNKVCAEPAVVEVVVTADYVKSCNETLVGIFPERSLGVISGVKGLDKQGKCSIDKDRPVKAEAKYNLCARDPYTGGADVSRCIFNNGRGKTSDVTIGGIVKSAAAISQTAKVDILDGEWQLMVTGIKNAKVDFNVTWENPTNSSAIKTQISNICAENKRSFTYTLDAGAAGVTACNALKLANAARAATVCADVTCKDVTKAHKIFNFNPIGSHYHYFPDSDGTRERFFRGTGNKMIAGVMINTKRFFSRPCEPYDTKRHQALFGASEALCIDERKIGEENHAPYGADPVYLSSSSMYDETEAAGKDALFNTSELNEGGIPNGFYVPTNKKLAKFFGHAVLYQNNLKKFDADRLTSFLQEGFFIDALTKSVSVTYMSFNAYDQSYHKFTTIFSLQFPSGGVEINYNHMSFMVDPYFNNEILMIVQVLYWFLVFLTCGEEILEMLIACKQGENYFSDGWNFLELGCIALQLFNFVWWLVILRERSNFKPREQYVAYPMQTFKTGGMLHGRNETAFNEAMQMYYDAEKITQDLANYETIQTCVLFFILCRWFKQLDFHPEFGVITRTCAQSWKSLSQWLVVFMVVQIVFILGGFYTFGQTVAEFATLQDTLFVQYQLLNGDLSVLASLWQTNNNSVSPIASYVYIFMYYGIVFIIMLNVLLGIIIDAYTDQRDQSAEDPLTPDESPWEEMSTFFFAESKACCADFGSCCRGKRRMTFNQIVEIPPDVSQLSDEEAEALNNRARLAAQLREIVQGTLALDGGTRITDANGTKIKPNVPHWHSEYYKLKYDKPVEMETNMAELLRTSHGDLTHEELKELISYQLRRYSVDLDVNKTLSDKVAQLAIWRYGKELNVESRRDIGLEHRNVMNEHRFNRLEEALAEIATTGTQQWGEVQKAIVTVAATQYIPSAVDGKQDVISATSVVSAKSVDTVNL